MRFLTNPSTHTSQRTTRLDEVQSFVETMRASSVQIPFATLQRARAGVDARRAKQYHQRGGQRFHQPKHARTLRTFTATARASEGIETTEYFSPSKINLFLRVTARRPDGFHDLASLFHVIDLGDYMSFAKSSSETKDTLICNDPTIPTDESNLVIKALNLFRAKTGITQRFWIELDKRVPHGAGLGGGSGNAATTLFAANKLCGSPATEAELLEWSGEIGSDISVFFSKGAAYCTGRGEIVEDVEPPLDLATKMLLVKPPAGCSTPAVFKALDLDSRSKADPLELMKGLSETGCSETVCINDLEAPAFTVLPELAELKEKLKAATDDAVVFMSGSGSTIVVIGDDQVPAFVAEDETLFKSPTRLITRKEGDWYSPTLQRK
jgi:4-diphosphocytidyl-2-C-methyl-D-erythritol kinase